MPEPSRYRFGIFELDVQSGELLRNGSKLKIQEQSLQVLALLLAHSGKPVTRDELRTRLWPADTFVDFDHSINAAIKRLREALSDEAENPRFIETLPRRGYRFIAPVSQFDHAQTNWSGNSFPRRFAYTSALIVTFGVLAGAAWFYFLRHVESKLPPLRVVPITSLSDRAECAAFSPDGNRLIFGRYSDSPDVSGIYVKQIGTEQMLQLTHSGTDWCPAWSPDGRFIAFSRYGVLGKEEHAIYLMSAIGGAERKLHFGAPAHPPLNWSPDGKFIAFTAKDSDQNTFSINLLSVENLETRKLSQPTAAQQDWGPTFSPDGKQLAFIRTNGTLTMADIFIMSANGGEARRLTFDNTVIPSPPTWTRDGRWIVFSSPRISIPTLWRIPVSGGSPIQIPQVGVVAVHPSVSPSGNRLAYEQIGGHSSIWSLQLSEPGKRDSRMLVTGSAGFNWAPEFSPDGKRIAFLSGRAGPLEVWTCNRDGSDLIQLTSLGGATLAGPPRWSPDGQRIAFNSALGEHNAIFVMKAEGGLARPLTRDASDNVNASWSHDGKWIYFTSNRSGEWQIWRMPSGGGEPLPVTKQGGFRAFESADGKTVYYAKTSSDPDIWRVPATSGQESPVSPQLHVQKWRDWALVDNGILFFRERSAQHPVLRFFNLATTKVKDVATLEKPGEWLSASVDGKFVLYNQFEHEESNIMLLENFR